MTTLARPLFLLSHLLTNLRGGKPSSVDGPTLEVGDQAWVPWTGSGAQGGTLALRRYTGKQASQPRFQVQKGEASRPIPLPFVRVARPGQPLSIGARVLAPYDKGCAYGRIASLSLESAQVDFAGALGAETRQYPRGVLIPLSGGLHFGAPVAYQDKSVWRWGQWLASIRRSHWVLARDGIPREVASAAVRPLSGEWLLPGDRAAALDDEVIQTARVIRPLDNGLNYLLRFETSGEIGIRSYAQVGAPHVHPARTL